MSTRIVMYVRVSTDGQTIESQEFELREYAKKKKFELVCEPFIEKESGFSTTRAVLDDLLLFALDPKNNVEGILTYSVDRLGRNLFNTMYNLGLLRDRKINYYTCTEGLEMLDDKGELTYISGVIISTLTNTAEQVRKTILINSRRGKQQKIRDGYWMGSQDSTYVTYGFEVENMKLKVNDREANHVRTIYDLYLSGKGSTQIVNELKRQGIPTKMGRSQWSQIIVNSVLKNKRYVIHGIIDQPTFDKAQLIREHNTNKFSINSQHDYVFKNNKFVCGVCGKHPNYGSTRKENDQYITCVGHFKMNIYALVDACYFTIRRLEEFQIRASKFTDDVALVSRINRLEGDLKKHSDIIRKFTSKKKKIQEGYEEDFYNKEQRDAKFAECDASMSESVKLIPIIEQELAVYKDKQLKNSDVNTIAQMIKSSPGMTKDFMNDFVDHLVIYPTKIRHSKNLQRYMIAVKLFASHNVQEFYGFLVDADSSVIRFPHHSIFDFDNGKLIEPYDDYTSRMLENLKVENVKYNIEQASISNEQ